MLKYMCLKQDEASLTVRIVESGVYNAIITGG